MFAVAMGRMGLVSNNWISKPGSPWLVLSSAGLLYRVTPLVLSSNGTAYYAPSPVLSSNGTAYNPI